MKKIGLIGCGFMGGMHLACYDAIEQAQVTAIADVRPEKLEAAASKYAAAAYTDAEEMIRSADTDIIDICLPTYLHTRYALLAMEAGKDVFIEKPVCLTEEEGKLLLEMQQKTGARVQVGQVIRFWDEYVWLRDTLRAGTYGKLCTAVFSRVSPRPTWTWMDWDNKPECSGTVATDLHIHDVDYVRWILGDPDSLTASASRGKNGEIEHIVATYHYKGGELVQIEGTWDYPATFPFAMTYRVKMEQATAVLSPDGLAVYTEAGETIHPQIQAEFTGNSEGGGNLSSLGAYYNELAYFIRSLEAGQQPTVAPLNEAVDSVRAIRREIEAAGGAVQ